MPQSLSTQQLKDAGIQTVNSAQLFPTQHKAGNIGLPMLVVENPLGRSVIALQGAHVMLFQPAGQAEMLWVSPQSSIETGVPIRGGIPLCLPWFGPGPDGKTLHGFARIKEWEVTSIEQLASGATRLLMELTGGADTSEMWPHAFAFRMEIEVGTELKLSINVENRDPSPVPLAFAFHTYFATPDVANARVSGFEGTTYIDGTDNMARKTQNGEITFTGFTQRFYMDVPVKQTIMTGINNVQIESETKCSVVWNAWDNDVNIPDMGAGNHIGYLCVERGDVMDHAMTLPPGGKYQARMTLSYIR